MTPTILHRAWRRSHAVLVWIVLSPVWLYRRVLSPMKQVPTCRFLPTCSEYAVEAVHERGIVVGSALAAWRIVRCNPLFRAGHDPVPRRHRHDARCGQEQH